MPLSVNPQLFIITGSNGAGKSTLKQALLPPESSKLEIFDGDIFYTRKAPNSTKSMAVVRKLKSSPTNHYEVQKIEQQNV